MSSISRPDPAFSLCIASFFQSFASPPADLCQSVRACGFFQIALLLTDFIRFWASSQSFSFSVQGDSI